MEIEKILEMVNAIIAIIGRNVTLGDAKTWLEVKENAELLKAETRDDKV